MDRAGIVGEDGPTHHGVFDIAFTRHIPDFTIMAPATGRDLADMLHTALALDGPCAIRYPRADIPESRLADEEFELAPIGKAKMLQQGRDLMIVALGSMVGPGLEAAATLRQSGVSVGVMDARFVKPLDRDGILEAVSQADHVIVVEEGIVNGGFGSAVTELVTSEGIAGCRISCMGIPDSFVHHGRRHELLDQLGLNGEGIVRRACEMLDINQASQLRCIGSSTQGSFR
jgi:1-deoxy-D-xylulose-5-phosphate synthase